MDTGDRNTHVPGLPAPPPSAASMERQELIAGISPHRMKRIRDMLAAGRDVGAISRTLSLPVSIVVAVRDNSAEIAAVRGGPMNLGDQPLLIEPKPNRTHR